jgi:hypothetical protein
MRRNLDLLRSWEGYANTQRYRRAVSDLNRLLQLSAKQYERLTLADHVDAHLSPLRSSDLLRACEHPGNNIFYPYFSSRLPEIVEQAGSDSMIGLSLNYLSQAVSAFSMIGFLKQHYPGSSIILGGGLITSWMANPGWKNPFEGIVDRLVSGPGEHALLRMMGVNNADVDKFPPCPDGLPLNRYLAPGLIFPYAASTGCYWSQCSFCPEKAEGARFTPASGEDVTTHLTCISNRYKPALIHLVDNALSPALMTALVKKPPGTPWYGFARITRELADEEFCRNLRQSGCVMLKLGLESGDQDVLDALQKGLELGTASRALKALKAAGISSYVYLLFGTPQETAASARKTLDFVAGHHNFIDFVNLAIFNLPINCNDAGTLVTRNFYDGDLSLYSDFVHPEGWNRQEVRKFLDKEFKSHPAVRPLLLRQPPFFTSNHAPLFSMAAPPLPFRTHLQQHT